MDMIFALVLLLFVAISVVWSVFVRKLAKTRIQSICAIASVLIALIGTIVLKSVVIDPSFIKGTLLPMASSLPAEVMDLINASDLVLEFVVGLPVALISPLIFVVLVAKTIGCVLPVLAQKVGLDPAVMASPFITTIVDALSLLIYFRVAVMLLHI